MGAESHRDVYAWLAVAVLIAAARLAIWHAYRHASRVTQYWRWSTASVCGALGAGLLWGGGSVLLLPEPETYQLFWVFVIGGCAPAPRRSTMRTSRPSFRSSCPPAPPWRSGLLWRAQGAAPRPPP